MNPGDEAQVYVRQVPFVQDEDMLFLVNGFMLTATVISGGVAPSAGSRANLVFDPGQPTTPFPLPNGPAAKLPPVAEFKTNLVNAQDYVKNAEGSLQFTGQQAKVQRISGTITLQRTQGLDSDTTLYVNVAAAPNDGTKDVPTSQSFRINVSNESDELHVEGLFAVSPQDLVQLWFSRSQSPTPEGGHHAERTRTRARPPRLRLRLRLLLPLLHPLSSAQEGQVHLRQRRGAPQRGRGEHGHRPVGRPRLPQAASRRRVRHGAHRAPARLRCGRRSRSTSLDG
jgi:hypothetical protein